MFWRKRKPSDFKAEVEAHLELEAARLQEQGLSEEEARNAARRAFGNVTQAEERFYESGRWLVWDHLCQDVRFGWRALGRLRLDQQVEVLRHEEYPMTLKPSSALFASR